MYITKNYRDFIREFNKLKFPFYEMFVKDKTLKISLYNEFIQTDIKPNYNLFILNYFTQKEIITGIEEAHKNIPINKSNNLALVASFIISTNFENKWRELYSDFLNRVAKNELESKYYSFNLEKTETVELLKRIDINIIDFKKFVLKKYNPDNYFIEAKVFSESIVSSINKLKYENLRNRILEEILVDEQNIYLDIEIFNNRKQGQICDGLKDNYRSLRRHFVFYLSKTNKNYQNPEILQSVIEANVVQAKLEIKPTFKSEQVENIFDLLKNFFSEQHQNQLLQILQTGDDTSEPLFFKDNGNRLADAFKQLINADIITGCKKNELEEWIYRNFKYKYRSKTKKYTSRYLNDIISTNKDKCKKPILNVINEKSTGKIKIIKA